MPSRYQRDRLAAAVAKANPDEINAAGLAWASNANSLRLIAQAIRTASPEMKEKIGGQTGPAVDAAFRSTAEAMTLKAAEMEKGGQALQAAAGVLKDAVDVHVGFKEPEAPGAQPQLPSNPTDDEVKTFNTDNTAWSNRNTAYLQAHAEQEEAARVVLEAVQTSYSESTVTMKEIHKIPDPDPGSPDIPVAPGGPGPGTKQPTGSIPTLHPSNPQVEVPQEPENPEPENPEPENPEPENPEPENPEPENPEPENPEPENPEPENPEPENPEPTTNVTGTTTNGTTVGTLPGGGTNGATAPTGGTTMGTGGAIGGGLVGGAAGLGLVKGGLAGGAVPKGATGGVKPIGGSTVKGAAGTLGKSPTGTAGAAGKGAAAGSSTTRAGGTKGAGGARGAVAGSATGRGSAGGRGSAAGGRGSVAGAGARSAAAGSTGRAGSAAGRAGAGRAAMGGAQGGGRGNGKDRPGQDRDHLIFEQDWLDDEGTAPGVLG